mmetsp:Transcript_22160/g.58311  ORF Transcript_22160/g.58311 Transcript_22160/m.58311 type:complete len:200 (+) Transcript_22160:74-673(+)
MNATCRSSLTRCGRMKCVREHRSCSSGPQEANTSRSRRHQMCRISRRCSLLRSRVCGHRRLFTCPSSTAFATATANSSSFLVSQFTTQTGAAVSSHGTPASWSLPIRTCVLGLRAAGRCIPQASPTCSSMTQRSGSWQNCRRRAASRWPSLAMSTSKEPESRRRNGPSIRSWIPPRKAIGQPLPPPLVLLSQLPTRQRE